MFHKISCKIKLHPLFFLCFAILLMTGYIKPFFYLFSLLFIHELGHILTGLSFRWHIKKVVVLPFGGLTVFQESLNKPIYEEFLITIMGPLFQIIYYFIMKHYIDYSYFSFLHYSFLFFNLLPIYPLDGSKLVLLVLEMFHPFYRSHQYIFYLSFVVGIVLMFLFPFHILVFLFLVFLFKKVIEEQVRLPNTFSKFLLERYLNPLSSRKYRRIYGIKPKQMMRDKKHLFYFRNRWLTEKEILKKWFDK